MALSAGQILQQSTYAAHGGGGLIRVNARLASWLAREAIGRQRAERSSVIFKGKEVLLRSLSTSQF
ncbi:MAG: hypothetical protein AB1832_18985 [Pseudomonadota bacterium]